MKSKTPKETRNHVIRSNGFYGTWGRGDTFQEALKNAKLKLKDNFTYFHFENDNWDIFDDGSLTWHTGNKVIHQEEFNVKQ